MNWEAYSAAFAPDNNRRALYVLDTTTGDWQRLLDLLNGGRYPIVYELDGRDLPPPVTAKPIFESRGHIEPLLVVTAGAVPLHCHFFTDQEIELDLDPRDVMGADRLEAILGLMRALGTHLGKDVVLTPEDLPGEVLFRYAPAADALTYQPPGGPAEPIA